MRKSLFAVLLVSLCVLPASADQVTLDDAIIDGSMCVGSDCVNGENFAFDTIVLKENNLRIYFNDTSNSASFPSNDWRLVANDSSNGGRNRFSIEDVTGGREVLTVQAGARNDALVMAGDAVGLGTSTPATTLHMQGGDTPAVRLEQTGDQGWQPQSWDVGGNEASFFVRDATAQTTPIRVEAGAVDDSAVVSASGDLTIAGTLSQGSSRDIKYVQALHTDDILNRLRTLQISQWQYHSDAKQSSHIGPMAEDFYQLFGLGADDKHIAASDVAGVAMASIQALANTIDRQQAELDRLKRQATGVEARLQRLEAALSGPAR